MTPHAEPKREQPATTPESPFFKPTVLGIGVGLATEALLVLLLVLLAVLIRPDGGAAGDPGTSAGRSQGDGAGTFSGTGRGSGNAAADDPAAIPRADQAAVEIGAGAKTKSDPSAAPSPKAETVGKSAPRPRKSEGISTFTIAPLPAAAAGNDREGSGAGAGFSDVGERLKRAGAKSGDVQISLAWNNINDLDLHVITPSGERIFFNDRKSSCQGELDVDMNATAPRSTKPVENIYWPEDAAPKGRFVVLVHHYANHGGADPTRYQVIVKVDGESRTFTGTTSFGGGAREVHHFTR